MDVATPIAIIGGVAAAGYAASRLLRGRELPKAEGEPEFTDADRAIDFEPAGESLDRRNDIVGDPSVRTSVGLET